MKYILKPEEVLKTDRFCWAWDYGKPHGGVYWFDQWGGPITFKDVQAHVNYESHRWFCVLREGLFYYVEE